MSDVCSQRVAVVVAAASGAAQARAGLRAFAAELRGRGELVFVCREADVAMAEVTGPALAPITVRASQAHLVPELWLEGYRATDAPLVAFSTTAMSPRAGWLDALLETLVSTDAAAVGGPIAPASYLAPFDRAVYLHRFARYLPPISQHVFVDPPGENCLFRRDRLEQIESCFEKGFWEADVHRHLRSHGDRLAMAAGAVVEFQGGAHRLATWKQRVAHAQLYAQSRMKHWTRAESLARALFAPAVPAVLLARIVRQLIARREPLFHWLPAVPDLLLLLAAWSGAEAFELARGVRSARSGSRQAVAPRNVSWPPLARSR
ncbi:MAG TPA: glycosyltransferase [Isosphaeraceae bacterium]|nr:glycosyltransferase [Isosphaeraceae bacterium]